MNVIDSHATVTQRIHEVEGAQNRFNQKKSHFFWYRPVLHAQGELRDATCRGWALDMIKHEKHEKFCRKLFFDETKSVELFEVTYFNENPI